jgi:hypothetical protein
MAMRVDKPDNVKPGDAATVCPNCGESQQLTKVKGCIRCLKCHFKFDCNGW